MTNLTVHELQPTEWNRWDEWLAMQPWGSLFSSAWWLDAECRALGGRPLLLGVFDGVDLVGGVALRVTDMGPLHIVRSPIHYNSIVLAEGSSRSRQQVLSALLDDIAQRGLIVMAIRCTADLVDLRSAVWKGWRLTAGWTVINDLSKWSAESQPTAAERRQARKALRIGVTARVEERDAGLLSTLIEETIARRRVTDVSQAAIKTLMKASSDHGLFGVARDEDGVALCATFVAFQGSQVAYCVWIGNSAAGLASGASALLYMTILDELQSRGFEYLDWCGGGLPGVSDFKLQFGGHLVTKLSIDRSPLWFQATRSARKRLSKARTMVVSAIVRTGRHYEQTDAS